MNGYPISNTDAARVLGDVVRRLGYSQDGIAELLDEDESGDTEDATVADRRLPRTPLGTAIRALYFQLPVPVDDAYRAFGRAGVEAAEAIGLAEVGARFSTRAR